MEHVEAKIGNKQPHSGQDVPEQTLVEEYEEAAIGGEAKQDLPSGKNFGAFLIEGTGR